VTTNRMGSSPIDRTIYLLDHVVFFLFGEASLYLIKRGGIAMFESEFCEVNYLKNDHAVLVRWKQFCQREDYREPLRYALGLLREHKGSDFISDTRTGFEDEPLDLIWALKEWLPAMAKTECKKFVFVVNRLNFLSEQIDVFSEEIIKYFELQTANSLEAALVHLSKSKTQLEKTRLAITAVDSLCGKCPVCTPDCPVAVAKRALKGLAYDLLELPPEQR
jgi:hypothetical protein